MTSIPKKKAEGVAVTLREGESISQAWRRFKRKVDNEKILETYREKQYYEKPTTKRKRAEAAAKARWKKKLKNLDL
jgi:small subunit ribosomal protein S21